MAVEITLYNQICTDWYINGIYTYTRCETRVSEHVYYYVYCTYEPNGGENDGGYGDEGGAGGELPPQNTTQNLTQKIQNVNSLNATEKNLLENALVALTSEGCLTNTIYNTLVNKGWKISFTMNSTLAGTGRAGYDPSTKTISFVNDSEINTQTLKEELFHAAQDASYSGGIYQFGSCGRSNIEFEAKLYTDVSKLGCCSMFPNETPINIICDYAVLVDNIRNTGSSGFTAASYNYWVNLFRQYSTSSQYNGPTSSSFSDTNVLNAALVNCK